MKSYEIEGLKFYFEVEKMIFISIRLN